MSLVNQEINLRRHIRWKIEKSVIIIMPCSNPVSCTIYDFCSRGLFLEFEHAEERILMHQRLHRKATVCFSVGDKKDNNEFQFDVEFMRVCSNGIGVAFENIPMEAFQALVNLANLTSVPISLSNLDNVPVQENKKEYEKTFCNLLVKRLPMILDVFFRQVDTEIEKRPALDISDSKKKIFYN